MASTGVGSWTRASRGPCIWRDLVEGLQRLGAAQCYQLGTHASAVKIFCPPAAAAATVARPLNCKGEEGAIPQDYLEYPRIYR